MCMLQLFIKKKTLSLSTSAIVYCIEKQQLNYLLAFFFLSFHKSSSSDWPTLPTITTTTISTTTNNTSSVRLQLAFFLSLLPIPLFLDCVYRSGRRPGTCPPVYIGYKTITVPSVNPNTTLQPYRTNVRTRRLRAVQCTKRGSCRYRHTELLFTIYHQVSRARMHASLFLFSLYLVSSHHRRTILYAR